MALKHGKRPTLKHKKLLKLNNLNPNNWLVVKDMIYTLEVVHRESGNRKIIKK